MSLFTPVDVLQVKHLIIDLMEAVGVDNIEEKLKTTREAAIKEQRENYLKEEEIQKNLKEIQQCRKDIQEEIDRGTLDKASD